MRCDKGWRAPCMLRVGQSEIYFSSLPCMHNNAIAYAWQHWHLEYESSPFNQGT